MSLLNKRQIDFVRTLREAGAVSRETAFKIDKTASIDLKEIDELVDLEVISRVAPYQYYVRAESRAAKLLAAMDDAPVRTSVSSPATRSRFIKTMIFWIIVFLIPILLFRLFRAR
jgi:hypothetical protein